MSASAPIPERYGAHAAIRHFDPEKDEIRTHVGLTEGASNIVARLGDVIELAVRVRSRVVPAGVEGRRVEPHDPPKYDGHLANSVERMSMMLDVLVSVLEDTERAL